MFLSAHSRSPRPVYPGFLEDFWGRRGSDTVNIPVSQSVTDPALGSAQQLTAATQVTAPGFNMDYSEVEIAPAPFQRSWIKQRLESFW